MGIVDLLESETVEVFFLGLDIVLAMVSLYLLRLLKGSLFERIPVLLFLTAIALFSHAFIEVYLTGYVEALLYAATSLLASLCIFLLLLQTYVALRTMMAADDGEHRVGRSDAA